MTISHYFALILSTTAAQLLSSPDLFPSSCQGLPRTALAPGPQYLGAAGNTLCRIQDFLGEKARKRVNETRKEKALLSGACQGLCTWIYLQQIWRERRKTTKKQKCSSLWQHGNQNMYTKKKKKKNCIHFTQCYADGRGMNQQPGDRWDRGKSWFTTFINFHAMINFKLPTRSTELLSWEELASWGEMYNTIPRYSISAKNTIGANNLKSTKTVKWIFECYFCFFDIII